MVVMTASREIAPDKVTKDGVVRDGIVRDVGGKDVGGKDHRGKIVSVEAFTHGFASWAGTGPGLMTATASLVVWFVAGDYFHFSNRWENALSVYIGIITFLMIFLMQRSQKKELLALHVKLNELIKATADADNRIINIEEQSEDEILQRHQLHAETVSPNP